MVSSAVVPSLDVAAAAAALRGFLGAHETVEVWEEGQRVARLTAEQAGFSISTGNAGLVCHFWSPDANLVRRVVWVQAAGHNRLKLRCLRMGKSQPSPMVLEAGTAAAHPTNEARTEFRQAVIAAARRDWPGWSYEPGGDGPAAARSGVQRFLFRRQQALLACVAVDERESFGVVDGALAQALVWAEQTRARFPRAVLGTVRLILPPGGEETVRQRRRWLVGPPLGPGIECWRLDRSAGNLNPVALSDCGNVASRLRRAVDAGRAGSSLTAVAGDAQALLAEIRESCPQTTLEAGPDGRLLFRLYGLEIAREASGAEALSSRFTFGYGREQSPLLDATRPLFAAFLRELAEQRVAGGDRRDPLYALQPERWMEHLLRSDLSGLEAHCDRRFVYAQVPVCVPGQRDVLDLLTVDREGRLLVLELKADEDVGFPLQALDYWLRVRHHQLEGDFERLGYFPGVGLSPLPPRLWMVAPALRWHPQTELLTRWLAPEVPWARIGINEEWRHGIQVVYRKEAHYAGE